MMVLHTNFNLRRFEAIDRYGVVLYHATTAAPVRAFIAAHGGEVEQPKQMTRTAARRMEQQGRGRNNGYGVSRSGKK